MRLVPINSILPGAILSKTIYSKSGALLLRAGYPLHEKMIDTARKNGVEFLYIEDSYSEQLIDNIIRPELKKRAIYTIKESFKQLHKLSTESNPSSVKSNEIINNISSLAGELVDNVLFTKQIGFHLVDIKNRDNDTYNHSVNTALLAIVLAIELGYEKKQLQSITVGTLLHDLGKLFIPTEILLKPGKLTFEEFAIIKEHPKLGYDYLKNQVNIDSIALSIVYEHHEKANGLGYPNNLKAKNISPFAKIVSICDVYEALTSDRAYRKAVSPNEALELLMGSCGTDFDLNMVSSFIKRINPYPVGSIVRLSNKDLAVIKKTNPKYVLRPVVSVINDNCTDINSMDLDLMERFDVVIEELYSEAQENVPSTL
ncbi:putative nucleotidyltransferase with HDIG domain [Alkalibaculum bacchi]|uniref:Putative nucleotidyltransferase with HDIG domain n=1 Tax=Alkalibaculum bacchi TaxID=645887 RepID=A0A366IIN6_9FIRM|nr:HD-GYP domain-containing protein [Alkalibaculum bacchi]RBP70138.1 putative nucleotidyltransferase with HDIG domain [Alkalibaculum bacchi]